jgi:predicted GNAT family N-acyltransferase
MEKFLYQKPKIEKVSQTDELAQVGLENLLDRLNLEKLPKIDELYQAYGYDRPKTEQREKKEPVEFNVNEKLCQQVGQITLESLNQDLQSIQGSYQEKLDINDLSMEIATFLGGDSGRRTIRYNLEKPEKAEEDNSEKIASFFIQQEIENQNNWDLGHRLIETPYRGQDLGNKMLKLIESSLQHIADQKNQDQQLNIEASQIGVFLYALKNGYMPENQEAETKLKQILNVNKEKYFVATGVGYTEDGRLIPGYVYDRQKVVKDAEKEDIEVSPDELEDFDLNQIYARDPDEYFHASERINLVKKFVPEK